MPCRRGSLNQYGRVSEIQSFRSVFRSIGSNRVCFSWRMYCWMRATSPAPSTAACSIIRMCSSKYPGRLMSAFSDFISSVYPMTVLRRLFTSWTIPIVMRPSDSRRCRWVWLAVQLVGSASTSPVTVTAMVRLGASGFCTGKKFSSTGIGSSRNEVLTGMISFVTSEPPTASFRYCPARRRSSSESRAHGSGSAPKMASHAGFRKTGRPLVEKVAYNRLGSTG